MSFRFLFLLGIVYALSFQASAIADHCALKFHRVGTTKVGTEEFIADWTKSFYSSPEDRVDARHMLIAASELVLTPKEKQRVLEGIVRTVVGIRPTEVPSYPEASAYVMDRLKDPETKTRVTDFLKRWETELHEAGAPSEGLWSWIKDLARQAIALPRTLIRLHQITAEAYSPANMDTNLWAYFGFHQEGEIDKTFRMRPWPAASIKDISAADIENMSLEEMIRVMRIAMEIEAPIVQYTVQSGEGFLALLPGLARFMGKSEAQAKYAIENGLSWCVSPWCSEEDRHGPSFGRMIERLTGMRWTPPIDNPTEVDEASSTMEFAEKHVDSRMATEWSASSVYVMLLAHTKEGSALRRFLENVMRDEVKHLAIISAAHVHLYGERPWMRMWRMLKAVASLTSYHAGTRSTASSSFRNVIGVFETLYTFALTEYHTRKWLRGLPPETLLTIFETESKLTELPESAPKNDEEREAYAALLAFRQKIVDEGKKWRDARTGWLPESAIDVGRQIEFNSRHKAELDQAARYYAHFAGAEDPTGFASLELVRRFARLTAWSEIAGDEMALFRQALYYRLRDYQIRNNSYIRGRRDSDLSDITAKPIAGKKGRGLGVATPDAAAKVVPPPGE